MIRNVFQTTTLHVHCFCQMSSIYARQPGVFCGPGVKCQHTQGLEAIEDVKAPPAEEGLWVDGVNTLLEGKQGERHVKNFDELFTTTEAPAAAEETTESNADEELS